MKWNRVIDKLPEIPKGKYGISVIVAQFDPCYDEINPGRGYSINHHVTYSTIEEITDFYEMCSDGSWTPLSDTATHWMYYPDLPEYDPEVLNPIFQWYHGHAVPQSPLKQLPVPTQEELDKKMYEETCLRT